MIVIGKFIFKTAHIYRNIEIYRFVYNKFQGLILFILKFGKKAKISKIKQK